MRKKTMRKNPRRRAFGRRQMMQMMMAGGATASLMPLLPRSVRGQDDSVKRVLFVYHGLGYLESTFWPTRGPSGAATDFTLGATQSVLEPYKDQLIYLDGMLLFGAQYFYPDDDNEHASGAAMTFTGSAKDDGDGDNSTKAYANGPSVDQVMADSYYDPDAPATLFRDMALGVSAATSPHHNVLTTSSGQPVVPQGSPTAAFDTFFASIADDLAGGEEAAMRRRALDQSILDHLSGELQSTRRRIGRQEREALDAHLEGLRALELRVQNGGSMSCTAPDAPTGEWGGGDPDKLRNTFEAHVGLIRSAFSCDLTRVASLQLGHCDGGVTPVAGLNVHGTTHAIGDNRDNPTLFAATQQDHRAIDRYWADRWYYLLDELANTPDGDGSLLDNTLIVWGTDTTTHDVNDIGSPGPHKHYRMPYFLAGGSNWAFPTGRHLVFDHPEQANRDLNPLWQSNSRLFVSMLQRWGVDVDTFGTMDVGSGTLPML